jgi:hypothetical protein
MGVGASFSLLKRHLAAIIVAGRLPSKLGSTPTYSISRKLLLGYDTSDNFRIRYIKIKGFALTRDHQPKEVSA